MSFNDYQELEHIFSSYYLLQCSLSILDWDNAVMAPSETSMIHARQIAEQNRIIHKTVTSAMVGNLLDRAEQAIESFENQWQKANLREMQRIHSLYSAVPEELQCEIASQAIITETAWRKAKETNDYPLFSSSMAPLLDLVRRKGECLGKTFQGTMYTGLLQEYDPQSTEGMLDSLFFSIGDGLPQLIRQIVDHRQEREEMNEKISLLPLTQDQQMQVCRRVVRDMGFDFKRGRLDKSAHPFSSGGREDLRITTRLVDDQPLQGLFAAMHECGHALYEMHLPKEFYCQPVGGARSMAVHEAIALFYEKGFIRTRQFATYLERVVQEETGVRWSDEQLYRLFRDVQPSSVRVFADEVTYIPHILLRYKIERALLSGTLALSDLPEYWSQLMEENLGVRPTSHKDGCLQDIHWSMGTFGYFPSYAKGLILSFCLFEKYRSIVESGNFQLVLQALEQDIFSQGCLWETLPVVSEAFESPTLKETVFAHLAEGM